LLTASTYGSLTSEADYVNYSKSAKLDMKIISKKYRQDTKNFIEQISINSGFFTEDEFDSNCAEDKHTKISVEIRISADIQRVKYRSVSSPNHRDNISVGQSYSFLLSVTYIYSK